MTARPDTGLASEVNEQRFRLAAIVESSDDAIIGKTLDGVVTSWNEGAHRLFGYSAPKIVGRSISLLLPAGCQGEEPATLAKLARGERVAHFDTVRMRKDGTAVDVSVTISPVRDLAGNLVGASKIVRDITERRRADEAVARATDTAEAARRELEAFSYSVAHDLRAPLRGMNGFAQVLLETYGDKLGTDGKEWLQEIALNARKMAALIDALLSLARLTRSELSHESVDLSSIVRATAAQLSSCATTARVSTWRSPTGCSDPFSGSIRPMSFWGRGSGSQPWRESSTDMEAASGPWAP